MHKPQQQVQVFHREVLDQPMSPAVPELRMRELRARLLIEESFEAAIAFVGLSQAQMIAQSQILASSAEAVRNGKTEPSLEDAIDGLCDTAVVTYGSAEAIGVDLEPFFDEVMRSNMAKKGGTVRADGKMLKPEGWTPPDIAGVLKKMLTEREAGAQFHVVMKAKHYNVHPSSIECIDLIAGLSGCIFNAVKYVWRAGQKNDEIEDLQKAFYYFRRAHMEVVDHARPPEDLLRRVLDVEPPGRLLGDVLRLLYEPLDGFSWYARIFKAFQRVEQEIEVRSK